MHLLDLHHRLPLRAKLSLWVSVGVSAIVVVLMLAMCVGLQEATTRSVTQVQAALVEGVARDVEGKLRVRGDALRVAGETLGHRLPIVEGPAMEEHFLSHPATRYVFDNVVLADVSGRVVYDSAVPPGGAKPPMADRAFFKDALRTGKLVIAQPDVGKVSRAPVLAFAAPVRDIEGGTIGVLVGLLRLDRPNFLSDLGSLHIGDAGYLMLTTEGETPVVISHPKRDRILQALPRAGAGGAAAQRLGASDATFLPPGSTVAREGVDAEGTPSLLTRRALVGAPWVLEAVYPTAEAFAGLRQEQRQVLGLGAVIAGVSWVMVWWLTTLLLAPMDKLRQAMQLDATGSENMLRAIRADSTDMAALLEAYYAQKERRLATETDLGLSERRLRDIADNLPACVAYIDRDCIYRFVNEHYRTLFGVEPERLRNHTIVEGIGEVGYESVAQQVAEVLQGRPQRFELGVADRPNCEHLLVNYLPDVDARGQVVGFYAMSFDITGRKKAELLLARSERRLKAITDSVPALIALVDRDQRYRFANARFRSVMGIEPAALIGQTMVEFLGAAAHADLLPDIEAALAGEHRRFERTGWKNNAETHFLAEYVPEFGDAGEVIGFVVMVLDITERKRTELALAKSEQRVRAITDNLPALVSHIDREQRYTFANAKIRELAGPGAGDLIGKQPSDIWSVDICAQTAPWIARALAGEQVSFDALVETRSGEVRHVEASYVPERDAEGQVVGFHSLSFDVTERKRREAELRAYQRLLDRTGSVAGVGGWELELVSGELSWTAQTRRIHEVSDDFVPGVTTAIDFYAPEGRLAIDQALIEAMEHGTPWDLELPFHTATGRAIWVRATGEVERENGRPVRMFGALQDVTQRVMDERQLREQAELLQVTLKSIGDGVITADELGCVRWMNPAAERMTGWTSEAAVGRPTAQVFHIVQADTRTPAPDPVGICLKTLAPVGLPARTVLLSVNGQEFAIEDSASPIHDARGELRGAVLVFHDVSEQRRMSDQMTHRATHDALTGLVNRSEFESRLERVLTKARDEHIHNAMMFIDLDQFKLVNDACGHAMGDKLLCQVSDLLRASVRNRDTLARLGGDEFGVILEHCTVEQAQRVAEGICQRMDEFRFVHDGRRFRIGTSIGLVPVDARWANSAALQKAADTACYAAKEAGRNRVHVWYDTDDAMHAREGETQWGSRLEDALDDNDFVLFAQRLQPLRTGGADDGLHCEVLIRLREADGTLVAPGRFLPAAERFHMASRIDRWVVRSVFEWLAGLGGSPDDIDTIAINLSGQSIGDRAFHRYVVQLLSEIAVDPKKLCFEVTETSAITNLGDASAFIREMRGLGVRVALDDFGAGASSFGYLKNLPVDYLKIDGQFIRNIERDPLDMAAVRCFHEVARAISVQTIAEFVETESIREVLNGIGIDFAQGYLIHRPEPLDDLLRRARRERVGPRAAGVLA